MKIELENLYTPYTIDTYGTFKLEDEEEIISNYNENNNTNYEYDDFEWEYDIDKYRKDLAKNLLELLKENIIDNVITKIESDLKVISPQYYNYTTDKIWLDFEINKDNLDKFIKDNSKEYEKSKVVVVSYGQEMNIKQN